MNPHQQGLWVEVTTPPLTPHRLRSQAHSADSQNTGRGENANFSVKKEIIFFDLLPSPVTMGEGLGLGVLIGKIGGGHPNSRLPRFQPGHPPK